MRSEGGSPHTILEENDLIDEFFLTQPSLWCHFLYETSFVGPFGRGMGVFNVHILVIKMLVLDYSKFAIFLLIIMTSLIVWSDGQVWS